MVFNISINFLDIVTPGKGRKMNQHSEDPLCQSLQCIFNTTQHFFSSQHGHDIEDPGPF